MCRQEITVERLIRLVCVWKSCAAPGLKSPFLKGDSGDLFTPATSVIRQRGWSDGIHRDL